MHWLIWKYYYDDRKFDFANYALIGHPILVGPEEKVEGCVYFASFDKGTEETDRDKRGPAAVMY